MIQGHIQGLISSKYVNDEQKGHIETKSQVKPRFHIILMNIFKI